MTFLFSENVLLLSSEEKFYLYNQFFLTTLSNLEDEIKEFQAKENEIFNKRKEFYEKFKSLNTDKYSIEIFDKFQSDIYEFKIDLQLSALNAKIKSLDMKDFSNIISVVGLSLEDESFKVLRKFSELKEVFEIIITNFNYIDTELIMFKYINVNYSKPLNKLKKFLSENIIPLFDNEEEFTETKIAKIFKHLINEYELRMVEIDYLQNNQFKLNVKKFFRELMVCFRKIKFLLNDYLNFVFKISYLTLITKIEIGKISNKDFNVVILTLEDILQEAVKIDKTLQTIYKYYVKNYYNLQSMFSKFSLEMNKLSNDYHELLINAKIETESMIKFLKNEIKKYEA